MSHTWPQVELKEVIEGLFDGPHATPKESSSGAIFLGIKNVTEDGRLDLSEIRHIAEDDLAHWTRRVVPQKNDIVFSYEATLHRYAKIPDGFRGCLGRRMALVRVNNKVCDVDFLFSYFLSPLWRYEVERHILTGATVDRIPLTHVPNFKVSMPPLPAQKKIAGILSAYDRLIENNLNRIKLLEEMAQITYEEWFVRLRFPGHESIPINSETGLPEGWRTGTMQDLFDFKNGYAFKSGTYVEDGQHKIVTIKNVQDGSFIPDTTDTIAELPSNIKPHHHLSTGDIIMSLTGNVGRVCLVYGENYLLNQRVAKVVPNNPADRLYVYTLLRSRGTLTQLENISNGAAQQNLSPVNASKMPALLPTRSVLNDFNKNIGSIIDLICLKNIENNRLREARDILLPRLMTGVIDVESYDPAQLLKEAA